VTDTHSLYSDLGGVPRSWVFTGVENDAPSTLDIPEFAAAINEGRLIGSNGPFFTVELVNDLGETATIGETVAALDGELTIRVSIEIPEWMDVDTIDVYSNVTEELVGEPGEMVTTQLAPTLSIPIDWDVYGEVGTVAGVEQEHHSRRAVIEESIEILEDAYVIVVVRDAVEPQTMYPILRSRDVAALGFANPIFVDFDGGGYDNFPLAGVEMMRATLPSPFSSSHVQARRLDETRPLTLEDINLIIESGRCSHGQHDASALITPVHRHGGLIHEH
jgi:hypothetical protein